MPDSPIFLTAWQVFDTDPGAGAAAGAALAPLGTSGMFQATAPGDLYLALHAAGRIPDPLSDRAEQYCAWVREREWWYRTDIDAPGCRQDQRAMLDFEGLDTFASVWLNGELIGRADNMFRRWRFDVTARLKQGANRLALCFTPPALAVSPVDMPAFPMASSESAQNKRNFMRKAQFGWGWDFAPDLVTTGIWKAATLRLETRARLQDLRFTTDALGTGGSAGVTLAASVDAFTSAGLQVAFSLRAPDGSQIAAAIVPVTQGACTLTLAIDRAQLWWTPELGAPSLYTVIAVLHADELPVDRRALRVGIRTITLDMAPDTAEPGTKFFRFVLNGVPLFARGVNWVPPHCLVGAIDTPLYRTLLTHALHANMNMVRVWGGGIYEHDGFYDLCDELGLLVWQDFMFACAPYPEHDPAFIANVRAEVADQVARLRHHACLALWCGNNESQAIQGFANSKAGGHAPVLGELFYNDVIPEVLARLDPATPYWPGSPFGGPGHNLNSMYEGDIHDWTVWHGLPTIPDAGPVGEYDRSPAGVAYTRYAEDMGRFISEYGIQSAPGMAAFRRALPEEQRVLGSAGFLNRLKDRPVDKVNAMLVSSTGLPSDLQEYVDFTQINQAEGLKFGIEHFRRRKPHCSGSLIWQFNDCWPGISWSIVDFYGFPKAAYYYVKRAYAPVMACFKAEPGSVSLWVVNDTLATVSGVALVALDSFDGSEHRVTAVPYALAPNASACAWRHKDNGRYGGRHVLSVRESEGMFPANQHLFVPIKDLVRSPLYPAQVDILRVGPRSATVTLSASAYLYFVHVLCDDPHVSFDDNYISLRPGETRVITAIHASGALDPSTLSVRWR